MKNIKKINLILQLRKLGITDTNVLSSFETIPREKFVDKELHYKAYQNSALPISCNQTISQPAVVAKMSEILEIKKEHNILEIGTGSGYQTAILSKLSKRIYTIERYKTLLDKAKKILTKLSIRNVVFFHGDGLNGWPAKFLFKRIIVSAVAKELPVKLVNQLSDDGIIILPMVHQDGQFITKVIKKKNKIKIKKFWEVKFVPLLSGIQ